MPEYSPVLPAVLSAIPTLLSRNAVGLLVVGGIVSFSILTLLTNYQQYLFCDFGRRSSKLQAGEWSLFWADFTLDFMHMSASLGLTRPVKLLSNPNMLIMRRRNCALLSILLALMLDIRLVLFSLMFSRIRIEKLNFKREIFRWNGSFIKCKSA